MEIIDVFRREGPLGLRAVVGLMSNMGPQDIYYGVPSVKGMQSPKPQQIWRKSEGKPVILSFRYNLGKEGETQVNALHCLKSFKATTSTYHQDNWPLGLLFCFLHFQIIWSFFRNSNNGKVSKDYDKTFFSQPCWFAVYCHHLKCMGKPWKHSCIWRCMEKFSIIHAVTFTTCKTETRSACKACAYFFYAVKQQRSICWVGVSVLNFHCSLRIYFKEIKEKGCFNQN